MRLHTILLATTFCFSIHSASSQPGAPAGVPPAQAKPVKRAVASFWTSAEPTFDEGTRDRINEALLSYSAIEVRGGWPALAKGTLEPGMSGAAGAQPRARPRRTAAP